MQASRGRPAQCVQLILVGGTGVAAVQPLSPYDIRRSTLTVEAACDRGKAAAPLALGDVLRDAEDEAVAG